MLPHAIVLAALLAAPMAGPPQPTAIAAIPDEPGAIVLPEAAILQTVAADLDGDGRREVVRLVRGDAEAVLAEVWALDGARWRLRGEPVGVVPPARIGPRIDPVHQATPVRLLVRIVDGRERVTVASQPHFEEIDVGPPCCLILHDLAIEDGQAVRRAVSGPSDFAGAVIVIDLDGDGTDELLSTQSLPPEGDIGYPILARVHRWDGDAFGPPTVTRLPVGSGDTPIRIGDSDGVPGDEAAIISTVGPPGLFRIRLGPNDGLLLDAAGLVAEEAVAVPIGEERGIALRGPLVGLIVAPWPPGAGVGEPIAEALVSEPRLVGTVTAGGSPRLVVDQRATGAIHVLSLPELLPPQGVTITRSPAAAAFAELPLPAFSGPIPGGWIAGEPAVIHAGRLIPSTAADGRLETALVATLAGAQPMGVAGDGDVLVIHHGPIAQPAMGPGGGVLAVPPVIDGAWTSIAPLALVLEPEADGGELQPELRDAVRRGSRDEIAVGPGGFVAEVVAPPGSRVSVGDLDPSVLRSPVVVPASGRLPVPFAPPTVATANPRYRATLLVLTPAGHAHRAAWDVRVLTEAPPVELGVATPFGSRAVEVSGRTAPTATVRVAGRPVAVDADGRFATSVEMPPWPTEVSVEVSDGFGNVAREVISGIGLFDYRRLPWLPITVALVVGAGAVLFLRVPHANPLTRREDDDAELEELEPD